MKIAGFVSELNPLTYGHKYLIDKIREDKAQIIITAMSPNFVMRGEPAIYNKFDRTKLALLNGVDIVLEIPTFFSLQSSDIYARKGVELLINSGITDLYFGVEEDIEDNLYKIVDLKNTDLYKENLKRYLDTGLSFNQSSKKALIDIDKSLEGTLNMPNNLLAVEYIRTIRELNTDINIHMIKRISTNYFDSYDENKLIQSASAIRIFLKDNIDVKQVPFNPTIYTKHFIEDYFDLIKYKIDSTSASSLKELINVTEGIENKIKSIKDKSDINQLINELISKRNRETKIKRILMSILLNIKKDEANDFDYIRILGFNSVGSKHIKTINSKLVITKIQRDLPKGIYREIDFTKIYDDKIVDNEYKPIII